jgi:leucyl-tRNA synthetase
MKRYNPQDIEPKWQQVWADTKLYAAVDDDPDRPKHYYLVEFPYPSGDGLHVGHVLSYTALDIMARHKRMQGFNVLYPMGFDEFGLPTENYAIKHKIAPQLATERNVATFERQLKSLGLSFDWDREVRTSDPNYYKWTQWIFLQLHQKGLAYQAEIAINWCPFEKTGLANEEVVDGKHERCGTPVERKLLRQWMLAITKYADRLASDLKSVDYLDRISSQQINWIGRSEGAEITWKLEGLTGSAEPAVTIYTTRPDTLFGATFLVVSPELANKWLDAGWHPAEPVRKYIHHAINETELSRQEEKTKTGVDTGLHAVHPLTGELVPVWVADYVLGSYGTGAIMAVPAHDDRDNEFARTFDLPIIPVIEPVTGTPNGNDHEKEAIVAVVRNPRTGETLMLDWGPRQKNWGGTLFIGGGVEAHETDLVEAAKREIAEETGYTDLKFISQAPIPVNSYYYSNVKDRHDRARMHGLLFELRSNSQETPNLDDGEKDKFKPVWIPDDKVLSTLGDPGHELIYRLLVRDEIYTGYGVLTNSGDFNGLEGAEAQHAIIKAIFDAGAGKHTTKYKLRDWIFSRQHYWGEPIPIIHCPTDGAVPVPETDLPVTLPVVDHYEPIDTGESPLAAIPEFVGTTCPKCGGPAKRETDTMPNWAGSSWYYLRYTDPHNAKAFADPAKLKYWTPVDLYNGGMEHTTLHLLYSRFWHKFLYDQGLVPTPEPYAKRTSHGMILGPDGQKMSKSKGNVINPDHVVEKYGADTIRLYEMFMGPFDEAKSWSEDHLAGVSRFLYRVWTLSQDLIEAHHHTPGAPTGPSQENTGAFAASVDRRTHQTLKRVHDHIGDMSFNLMISALMEYINFLSEPKTKTALLEPQYAALAWRTLRTLILMLAPSAPHIAEELWEQTGGQGSVHVAAWPAYDPELIKEDVITVVVQINGKVRANLALPAGATDDDLKQAAHADPKVAAHLKGHTVLKTIVVPRKLVNFVVKS